MGKEKYNIHDLNQITDVALASIKEFELDTTEIDYVTKKMRNYYGLH